MSEASAEDEDELHMQMLAEYETSALPDPPLLTTLNHGGPGICRMCYPNGAPTQKQPLQQGELAL